MNLVNKTVLYFNTVKYLKFTQIWHRFSFRMYHPKPDFSPAPEISIIASPGTAFPKMPNCYLGNDIFQFLNEKECFSGWNEKNRDKLWLYNLHYFDWLRQNDISTDEGNKWILKWIEDNPPPVGNGWEPYPLSLRIVNWIKWYLCGHDLPEKARHSLAVQVRFLRKRLEYHLLANHLLANAKALVFAGVFFEGTEADQWLQKGLEIYRKQLPEQILSDGGHFELSPMYHSIILEDLLDLKNIHAPLELDEYIEKMSYWLSVLTGPDGKIALFNDAADGIALSSNRLKQYAESLGFETKGFKTPVFFPLSGYARISNGDLTLIADCGEIGPSYQPGHAHADALSFEVWKGNKKIITNSGTCRYYDSPERKYQRSSAAHNTLVVDSMDSSEIWGAHRVARRGFIVQRKLESANAFTASFQNYAKIVHRRKWEVSDNMITIEDQIQSKDPKEHKISLFCHILDDLVKISTSPVLETKSIDTLYSPKFGLFETKKSFVFTTTFRKTETIKSVLSIKPENNKQ